MSEKTWEETKAILDDPYVSADTKQMVLEVYTRAGDGNREALAYYEKYDVALDPFGGHHRFINPDVVYEAARRESEDAGYADRQVQDRLGDNQAELDSARAPGAGGVTNSDELFDLAKDALRVFEQFIPVDEGSPASCKHVDSPLSIEDVRKRFDEQRGIDFQKFSEEAQRLREAHGVLDELHGTTESNLNSLYKEWTGAGANASYQKYSEQIAPNIQELLEYLEGGAEVIETAMQTVFEACKRKADEVIALYTPTVGSATPETATKVMKLARGEIESQDEILEVAAWVDAETGSNIESTIRADDCGLNEENKAYTAEQCRTWVRESWNPDLYDNLHRRFTQICDDAKEAVDTAWEELNTYFADYSSEFPAGSGDTSVPPPTGQPQPNAPDVGGGPGPGGGAGGPGPGGGPSGGGGTPSVPEIGTPDDGKNPITGDDLEINPETGEPYPIDPETGDAVKDLGDEQHTLTVEKGDRTFEMTEPDADGKMNISVDDGSGQPKDYALDFGGAGQADVEPGEAGEFGPRGSGGGEGNVYRPGPDGKIHIEDGSLTIVAEQPEGPDGPTTVTVDDGTPPPTTYTLGEAQDDAADAGLGVSRDQIRTMPAPAPDGPPPAGGGGSGATAGESGDSTGGGTAPGGGMTGAGGGAGDERGLGGPSGGTDPQAASAGGGGSVGGGGDGGERLQAGAQSGVTDSVSSGAGLGSTPGGMAEQPVASSAQGTVNSAGGTGMMGGMGAMGGAGGQGGGDQERSSNPYRIDGAIFETEGGGSRISGSLLGDDDSPVRFDR